MKTVIKNIKVEQIFADSLNPRKVFEEADISELAESIKQLGILQPITVREKEGKYFVVCGERRWRAAKVAALDSVPAIIRDLNDDEAMDFAITENLQRKDVSPMEEADAFAYLQSKGSTIADLCARFGKSEFFVRGRLRLGCLTDDFRKLLDDGVISISQAAEICKFDEDIQAEIIDRFKGDYFDGWEELTPKALYKRILGDTSTCLKNAIFDTSDCLSCSKCARNLSLFENDENMECVDEKCYERKKYRVIANRAYKLQDKHPSCEIYANASYNGLLDIFAADGRELHKCSYGYGLRRVMSSNIEDIEMDILNGAGIAIMVDGSGLQPYYFYTDEGQQAGVDDVTASSIEELKKKDKRNLEIADEKATAEVNDFLKKVRFDTPKFKDWALSQLERTMMLRDLIWKLEREEQLVIAEFDSYRMPGFMVWEVAEEATAFASEKAWIEPYVYRCALARIFGRNAQKCEKYFAWVDSLGLDFKTGDAETRHLEAYEKKKVRINERIAAILTAEADADNN